MIGAFLASSAADWQPLSLVLVLLAIASVSQLFAVQIGTSWFSASTSAYVIAMALLGPTPAVAIAVASLAGDLLHHPTSRSGILISISAHAFFPLVGGILIGSAAAATGLGPADAMFGLLVIGTYLVVLALNWLQVAGLAGEDYRQLLLPLLPIELLIALATAGVCYAYGQVGLPALLVLAAVAMTFQYLVREVLRSHNREQQLAIRERQLAAAQADLRDHSERLEELADHARRLVDQVLEVEERERRSLADALHEEALQNLLAARQDLKEAEADDRAAVLRALAAIDRTVSQLRDEVFELHPLALKHGGLAAALTTIANQHARRAGFDLTVEIDPSPAGESDQLLLSVARELLINATKHSGATEVMLRVGRKHKTTVLRVEDNGRGFDPAARASGLRAGHLGLASIAERVETVGGQLRIDAAPGAGTRVTVTVPPLSIGKDRDHSELLSPIPSGVFR